MDPKEHLILYCDDEHANRVVFQQTFGKVFRVVSVDSGPNALAVLSKEPVAVLVTDQRMPGMSGDELLMRFKALSPDTVRIVVTAYSDLDPILRAVNEGLVVRYIVKPWDRKELEEILRWALEAYVLGRQNSALQLRLVETERLMTLGQVSAHILHDLSGSLASLSPNLERLNEIARIVPPILTVLADGGRVQLTDEQRKWIREYAAELPDIAADAATATKFMVDVLGFLRAFQRKGTPAGPRACDPAEVVRVAMTICRQGAIVSRSKLEYDGPTDLPKVGAGSTELLQVFLNLVRNAQQAIEEAGRGGAVVVHASDQGETVRFTVRDNGPGIPPDVLARLGTPFFTTRSEGTGLGVAQCKRLVGSLGGDFEIESTVGRGTTVTFTIPKAR